MFWLIIFSTRGTPGQSPTADRLSAGLPELTEPQTIMMSTTYRGQVLPENDKEPIAMHMPAVKKPDT